MMSGKWKFAVAMSWVVLTVVIGILLEERMMLNVRMVAMEGEIRGYAEGYVSGYVPAYLQAKEQKDHSTVGADSETKISEPAVTPKQTVTIKVLRGKAAEIDAAADASARLKAAHEEKKDIEDLNLQGPQPSKDDPFETEVPLPEKPKSGAKDSKPANPFE